MSPWDLNLRHLRAFSETCRLGSLAAVAQSIHLSQPAVTQAINKLEQYLNLTLFKRGPQGMAPTEHAELILPRVKIALEMIGSNRITSAQARAFIALARGGSYSEASAATGLAAASLHRAITDLEISVGNSLVDRRGRGIEITSRGKRLARRLRLAEAELNSALNELAPISGRGSARISIGAMPLCRARLLPAAVVSFQKDFPTVAISIAEGSFAELIEPLRDGELDILIGALRSPSPGADIDMSELFLDRPVVIGRNGHPLSSKAGSVTLEDLHNYPWVVPPPNAPLRQRWDMMMSDYKGAKPRIPVECASVIAARQILLGTDYLTVLSPDQVAVELEAGWVKVISTTADTMSRQIGVYSRRDWRPTEIQKSFLDRLAQHAADQ